MAYNKEKVKINGSFGKRLLELLKERNISQGELARQTGVSLALISRYISGERVVNGEKLRLIADYLRTTPEYLSGNTEATANERKTLAHAGVSFLMRGLDEDIQELVYNVAMLFYRAGGEEPDNSDTIGRRVESLMQERGLTQVQLAEKMGTTQQVISTLINSEKRPTRAVTQKICEALDVPPQLVLGEIDETVAMTPTQIETERILGKLSLKSQQVLYEVCLRFVRATNNDYLGA